MPSSTSGPAVPTIVQPALLATAAAGAAASALVGAKGNVIITTAAVAISDQARRLRLPEFTTFDATAMHPLMCPPATPDRDGSQDRVEEMPHPKHLGDPDGGEFEHFATSSRKTTF